MENALPQKNGVRARKRRETRNRIAKAGLELFLAHGYEATTLEAIAEAAGISRRTFFYYFRSKEDILPAWQSGLADAMHAAVLAQSAEQSPLDAVRKALVGLTEQYQSDQSIAIDRFMRNNPVLKARSQSKYVQQEQVVYEALCELWPQAERREGLRLVAMISIGAMRLAVENWSQDNGKHSIVKYLNDAFDVLKAEM
jgi:AcrR family transcriptional regulator